MSLHERSIKLIEEKFYKKEYTLSDAIFHTLSEVSPLLLEAYQIALINHHESQDMPLEKSLGEISSQKESRKQKQITKERMAVEIIEELKSQGYQISLGTKGKNALTEASKRLATMGIYADNKEEKTPISESTLQEFWKKRI